MLSYIFGALKGDTPEDFSWKTAPSFIVENGVKLIITTPFAYATHIYGNSYARVAAQSFHHFWYGAAPSFITQLAANARYYRSESDMIEYAQDLLPPMMTGAVLIGGFLVLTFGQDTIKAGYQYCFKKEEGKTYLPSKGKEAASTEDNEQSAKNSLKVKAS